MSRLTLTILCPLLLLCGCAKPPAPRPKAGDTVSIEMNCLKTWEAGTPVILSVKMQAKGPQDKHPLWLTHAEVPHDQPPRATLTFWRGDELVASFDDVAMTPEC